MDRGTLWVLCLFKGRDSILNTFKAATRSLVRVQKNIRFATTRVLFVLPKNTAFMVEICLTGTGLLAETLAKSLVFSCD